MARRVTKVTEALNSLDKKDVYSLMLFTLYKMKDDPEFLTLTELSYILEGESIIKFLSYFGGMTIKVPTLRDLRLVLDSLKLYQFVNLEKGTFEEGLKAVSGSEFTVEEIKDTYAKICGVVADYDFDRD